MAIDADYQHEALAAAEQRHFWFVSRARLLGWTIRRYFPEAKTILEVGCGRGGVTAELRRSLPASTVVAGAFDVACGFDVLEHLDDDGDALDALCRAVRPGGGVVLTVPQHPSLWS